MSQENVEARARVVIAAYVLLAAVPFVIAATRSSFWEREHNTAPVAAAVWGLLLVALALRRRWAWYGLAAFETAVLLSNVVDFTGSIGLVFELVTLGLLFSPPVRGYVGLIRPTTQ
jgi:hypothetical protein